MHATDHMQFCNVNNRIFIYSIINFLAAYTGGKYSLLYKNM